MDDQEISRDFPQTSTDLSNLHYVPQRATENFLRLCRLITVLCNDLFRNILSHYIKPSDLRAELDNNKLKLVTIMNTEQKKKIYPTNGNASLTSNDLDISVIYILLRNICNIPDHYNGWGNYPNKYDTSIAACIERIRIQRGIITGHSANGRAEDEEFKNHWSEIRNAVVEIENQLIGGDVFQRGIDHMLTSDLGCVFKRIYRRSKGVQANLQPENRCASNSNEAEAFYNNKGDRVKFAILFEELAAGVPEEKIAKMRSLIQNSCEGIGGRDIQNAVSARDCLTFLTNANLLTWKDVIFIQYLLKKLDCGQLYEQCYRYAKKVEALCFHEQPPEKGFRNVHFHVHGNLNDYGPEQIENIKTTVASILECSSEEILVGGFCPSSSFIVVLSIKEIYLNRLFNLEQEDKEILSRLDIDCFIIDLNVVFFESSREKEWHFYYDQRNSSKANNEDQLWMEGLLSRFSYQIKFHSGKSILPATENIQQFPPNLFVYPSHSEVDFLDFVKPYSALIPEMSKPNGKIQFKERVFYTICAIFIFLVCREIPLFGIKSSRTEDIFFFMRDITASKKGTLMEFGIFPICIAADIVELFVDSKLPHKDRNPIDNELIKGANKLFEVLVTVVLASLLVTNGIYGEPAELGVGVSFLIIIQLTLAGLIISLLIDMINNGYGLGYGIYLFIATNVCGTVMWKAFSPETVTNDRGTEFEGAIIALFNVLGNKNFKGQAFLNAFSRQNLPNLMHLLCTINVCCIFIYILRLHVSLPIKSLQFRGHTDNIEIKPPYILILHITMMSSYLMSLFYFVSKMLAEQFSGYSLFNFIGVWADVAEDGPARSYPTGGLCYYLSPPETHIISDPVQAVFYTGFKLGYCAILFNKFNSLLGLSAKEIAKSLKDRKMVLVGQLETSMVNELNGYISTTVTCSGLLFGALSAVADYMGVFGSGPGILLAITLISAYYDICKKEQKRNDGYNTLLF